MSNYSRLEVLSEVISVGIVPLFYHEDFTISSMVIDACGKGGARLVEYTNRGENALENFRQLIRHIEKVESHVILGAGSIDDPFMAASFIQAGANFIVSPSLNIETARLCNRYKIAYFPGCTTPTEIALAEEYGVEICKLFPADQISGQNFIKAVLGPRPWTRLMPTGGIQLDRNSISNWIKAGAAALGIGSSLISKNIVHSQQFDELTDRVSQVIGWIMEARQQES